MNINVAKQDEIKKQIFDLKPAERNGLLLLLRHSNKQLPKIRFLYANFNKTGQLLASLDNNGNVFIIDFSVNKFWNLPNSYDCSFMKFSNYNDNLLLGSDDSTLALIDVDTGNIVAELMGHQWPVKYASFSSDYHCLTSSNYEAIIWDLKTNTKVQILNLEQNCILKHICFIPVTNDILACFNDDVIQIWKNQSFDTIKILEPITWNKYQIKHIIFTKNGRGMLMGLHPPHLVIFLVNSWKLCKLITLPHQIQTIKKIDFIPQLHDGGSNRIVAILGGQGIVYFVDIQENVITNKLVSNCEIIRYDFSLSKGFIVCILSLGDVEIYDVEKYVIHRTKTQKQIVKPLKIQKLIRKCSSDKQLIKQQLEELLQFDKLQQMLKEFGQYPNMYRTRIWEELLQLPNNRNEYNSIIDHITMNSFQNLYEKYPLINNRSKKNLKKLLNNLTTWSPFFANVDYLPIFVFPFVKVFHNKPIACFEAVCTIIMNWCQFWFEYFPLPPINILAMIENILLEHDPQLLDFLARNSITTTIYAWPLLESAFSEVLTSQKWSIFWDHVLTNEPSFLLCAVVAYNILQRKSLPLLKNLDDFQCFYRKQNPIDIKILIKKTYYILNNTSERLHPRQYLSPFRSIENGKYPSFCNYPKTIINYQQAEMKKMKEEINEIGRNVIDEATKQRTDMLEVLKAFEMENEENMRLYELENHVKNNLKQEQESVKQFYEYLSGLREKLEEAQNYYLNEMTYNKVISQIYQQQRILDSMLDKVLLKKTFKDYEIQKNELFKIQSNIVRLLGQFDSSKPNTSRGYENNKLVPTGNDNERQGEEERQKAIAASIAVLDDLIKTVQNELLRSNCSYLTN